MTRYRFYREHKYLSFLFFDLERACATFDFSCPEAQACLVEKFEGMRTLLQAHAQHEAHAIHALIKTKSFEQYQSIEAEHHAQDKQLTHLFNLLTEITTCSAQEAPQKGELFYLAYRQFIAHMLLHFHKEETEILATLQALYSDEELRAVEAKTYQKMTPQEMINMLTLLSPHFNFEDHLAFLTDIALATPEKLVHIWPTLNALLPPKLKTKIVAHLAPYCVLDPSLASAQ